jgi:amino acid transporter
VVRIHNCVPSFLEHTLIFLFLRVLVGFYNPLLALISMMVIPMETIYAHPSEMLAEMAGELGGNPFKTFLCIDAVVILCGGVMTAIVGVSGLIVRLSKDKILPEALSFTNRRGAPYAAICVFVLIAVSLFLVIFDPTDPTAINNFGGVFAISFLTVLTAFGIGAVMLKLYRPRITRLVISKWWEIIISVGAVVAGLVGNIVLTPGVFYIFLAYLSGFLLVLGYMFYRVEILSFQVWMVIFFSILSLTNFFSFTFCDFLG